MKKSTWITLVIITVITASVSVGLTKESARKTMNSQSLRQTADGDLSYYVAKDGNDHNPGTIKAPFATLTKARDHLRTLKKAGKLKNKRVTIFIRAGFYQISETFELNEKDSGTTNGRIIYTAYPDEKVIFSGGPIIDPKHIEQVSDADYISALKKKGVQSKVKQVSLKEMGITSYGHFKATGFRRPYVNAPLEVFIDNKPLFPARWPNIERSYTESVLRKCTMPQKEGDPGVGAVIKLMDTLPDSLKHITEKDDVCIEGFPTFPWAADRLKVKSIDPKTEAIETVQPHMFGFGAGKNNSFYFLNVKEELDYPGEYFLNKNTGILYFYPPVELKPETKITVSLLDKPFIAMENASCVSIENITFENARGIGIYIEGGEKNLIRGCTIRNIGQVGVCLGRGVEDDFMYQHPHSMIEGYQKKFGKTQKPVSRKIGSLYEWIWPDTTLNRYAGKGHGIVDCDIYNTGMGGISLGGGDRKTLESAGNYVENCEIFNFNRIDCSYKAAVNVDGVGNIVRNNRIHESDHMMLYVHGNEHLLELNEAFHSSQNNHDNGLYYIGRDPSERGNVLKNNFLHHMASDISKESVTGVYMDDGSSANSIIGNVFHKMYYKKDTNANSTIALAGGSYNIIKNNVFLDINEAIDYRTLFTNAPMTAENAAEELYRLKAVNYTASPWKEKYPDLLNLFNEDNLAGNGNVIENNIAFKANEIIVKRKESEHLKRFYDQIKIKNNYLFDKNPGFKNLDTMDFSIDENTLKNIQAQVPGFENIPFNKIGLYPNEYRKKLRLRPTFFEPNGGYVKKGESVTLSSADGGDIYYTTDGTAPTKESYLYTKPINITKGTRIRTLVLKKSYLPSFSIGRDYHFGTPEEIFKEKLLKQGWITGLSAVNQYGVTIDGLGYISFCDPGDWVQYEQIDFAIDGQRFSEFEIVYSVPAEHAGRKIDFRIDSPTGDVIATHTTQSTGSWASMSSFKLPITKEISGKHSLFLCFDGNGPGIANFAKFRLFENQ